jgi:hypothetical protein
MGKESQRNGPYGVPQGKACAGPIPPGERSASGVAASVSEWNPEQPPIKVQNVTGGNGANGAGVFTAKYAKEREDRFFNRRESSAAEPHPNRDWFYRRPLRTQRN